jgi:hypothetical protein
MTETRSALATKKGADRLTRCGMHVDWMGNSVLVAGTPSTNDRPCTERAVYNTTVRVYTGEEITFNVCVAHSSDVFYPREKFLRDHPGLQLPANYSFYKCVQMHSLRPGEMSTVDRPTADPGQARYTPSTRTDDLEDSSRA